MSQQKVLVSGAAGHLGQAVVRRFRAQGAQVVALARRREQIEALFGDDAGVQALAVDLADAQAVHDSLASLADLDAVVHTVGGFAMGERVEDAPDSQWQAMYDMNVGSFLNLLRGVVPALRRRGAGAIVSIGAAGAAQGAARMAPYIASKAALQRISESLAEELKEDGVRVNCVLPGVIDTPPNRAAMPDADVSRWVTPDQLAEVIAYLCSPAASAVTGVSLPVRGRG